MHQPSPPHDIIIDFTDCNMSLIACDIPGEQGFECADRIMAFDVNLPKDNSPSCHDKGPPLPPQGDEDDFDPSVINLPFCDGAPR